MALAHMFGHLLVLVSCFWTTHQLCADIDTIACQTMSHSNPNMCSDPTLSQTACPKFCNLCPLQCYQCSTTFDDHHLCTTTKTCAQGEVCMKKEVTSVVDGHHEYQLSCEPKHRCDGRDLLPGFGKRKLNARDVSISCCYKDLCNTIDDTATTHRTTPKPQTTTIQDPYSCASTTDCKSKHGPCTHGDHLWHCIEDICRCRTFG